MAAVATQHSIAQEGTMETRNADQPFEIDIPVDKSQVQSHPIDERLSEPLDASAAPPSPSSSLAPGQDAVEIRFSQADRNSRDEDIEGLDLKVC